NGATDVSQVLAGIDWVVQHRNDNGMNIRVVNLSFGTDSTQSYLLDPLAYAAEVAWLHGIVVVVSAGNTGFGSAQLNDPAYDPYVLAVAADDTKGSDSPDDDAIPDFQTRGNAVRHPDLVAPGKSIVGLRDPGSFIDQAFPAGRLSRTRLFRGCGSSARGGQWTADLGRGNAWSGCSWRANTWSANTGDANARSGKAWSANSWSANTWSGNSWSGGDWGDSGGVTSPYAGNSWSSS